MAYSHFDSFPSAETGIILDVQHRPYLTHVRIQPDNPNLSARWRTWQDDVTSILTPAPATPALAMNDDVQFVADSRGGTDFAQFIMLSGDSALLRLDDDSILSVPVTSILVPDMTNFAEVA